MVRNTIAPAQKICFMSSKNKFTTINAAKQLMSSMEVAINNMIDEIKKPVDPEINGSARKAELQSIKQTATDCKELIVERQRLEQMIKDLSQNGSIEEAKDYSGGFAERFSK
jgi:hypothetical protein